MKRFYKIFASWFLCLFLVLSQFIVSFADVNTLMIGSDSNALMTLELDDSDYMVMPMSSMGAVTNTVSSSTLAMSAWITDANGSNGYTERFIARKSTDGRYSFSFTAPDDFYISSIGIILSGADMPPAGSYSFGFDLTSHISYTPSAFYLYSLKRTPNASSISNSLWPSYNSDSGDIYLPSYNINLTNIYTLEISISIPRKTRIGVVGGSFAVNFTPISSGDYPSTGGTDTSDQDYQYNVSSSLSDLSSSVDSMTEDLSSAAENLEYISTSQNLIIQGIDNVVMHISDQLFAFWNQLFNLIHLPTMAKMDDIITAINNMDLEIEVNLDGLKSTINNMSTAVQNKLQSTTNQITGGYDNSGIVSDQTELDSVLNEYQQAEDELFDDAKDHLNNFEFDTPLDQFIKPIQDISYFMTGIFNGLAGLNIPIQFSLTLTIALILIGYYRIKR